MDSKSRKILKTLLKQYKKGTTMFFAEGLESLFPKYTLEELGSRIKVLIKCGLLSDESSQGSIYAITIPVEGRTYFEVKRKEDILKLYPYIVSTVAVIISLIALLSH